MFLLKSQPFLITSRYLLLLFSLLPFHPLKPHPSFFLKNTSLFSKITCLFLKNTGLFPDHHRIIFLAKSAPGSTPHAPFNPNKAAF
jgi:hypothetical protein